MKHVTLLIVALINAMVLINEANATSPLADDMDFKTKMKSALECDTCYVILPAIRLLVEHNETSYLNTVCSKLKIEDNTVCNSILSQYQVFYKFYNLIFVKYLKVFFLKSLLSLLLQKIHLSVVKISAQPS